MSISSGLRKNILPKNQVKINKIYEKGLNRYLNLVAIHGDNNKITHQMYSNDSKDQRDLIEFQQ